MKLLIRLTTLFFTALLGLPVVIGPVYGAGLGDELFKLTASDAAAGDVFGNSVAIGGNTAIVRAEGIDDAGDLSGSAYLYDVSTGYQLFKLTASDAAAGDRFGDSVAVSGNTAVVGALFDADAGGNSGSAYVFDVFVAAGPGR